MTLSAFSFQMKVLRVDASWVLISLLECCACEAYVIFFNVDVQQFNCCLVDNIFREIFAFQGALYLNFTVALSFIIVGWAQNLLVVDCCLLETIKVLNIIIWNKYWIQSIILFNETLCCFIIKINSSLEQVPRINNAFIHLLLKCSPPPTEFYLNI